MRVDVVRFSLTPFLPLFLSLYVSPLSSASPSRPHSCALSLYHPLAWNTGIGEDHTRAPDWRQGSSRQRPQDQPAPTNLTTTFTTTTTLSRNKMSRSLIFMIRPVSDFPESADNATTYKFFFLQSGSLHPQPTAVVVLHLFTNNHHFCFGTHRTRHPTAGQSNSVLATKCR